MKSKVSRKENKQVLLFSKLVHLEKKESNLKTERGVGGRREEVSAHHKSQPS